nr:reverse transcriptase domain-containing protein [Tanacetum cinerariifolium]
MLVDVGKFTFLTDFVILEMEEYSKVPLILGRPFLHTADAVIRVKQKQLNLGAETKRMIFHINSAMKHSYSNDNTCFSIDIIDEILEEYFDALDKRSEILHFIERTILEEKLFAEFDEIMAMTANENFESESDTKEPPFEKITFNTDYKIKTSLEEPLTDLNLKPLPNNLEYIFLHMFKKQDAKPCLIHWIPLLQEFDIKIKDRKDTKNVASDHLSRIKKDETSDDSEVNANFPRETLMDNFTVKELMVVVFALDKLCSCLVLSKTIVHTDHATLRHMFKKQDAKPHLIHWIPLLQEFDIKIKDKNDTENVASDHLSQIKKDETSDDSEVNDNFPGETLMEINTRDKRWFIEFANYLVSDIIPKGMTYQQKNNFFLTSNTTSGRNPTSSKYHLTI